MENLAETAKVIGPVAAVLLGMWILDRKQKAEAPKQEDPAAALVQELMSLRAAIAELRHEMAELSGFIKGRMK